MNAATHTEVSVAGAFANEEVRYCPRVRGWDGDPTSAFDCECGEVIEDPDAEACEGCLGCDDPEDDGMGEDGPPSSRNYSHPHSYGFDIEV